MSAPESEYGDAYGLPHEQRAQWGAKAEQSRQAAALKGMNPSASQFTNINPNTAPSQASVAQRGAQLSRGVANYQPKVSAPPAASQPQPAAPREYGQPRRGAGAPPGTPLYGFNQKPQAPLGGKYSRGYGTTSGLLPEDNQYQRNYFGGGPSHYFRQLAQLPNASPEMQYFAKKAVEQES